MYSIVIVAKSGWPVMGQEKQNIYYTEERINTIIFLKTCLKAKTSLIVYNPPSLVLIISALIGFSINFMASQLWFWPMSVATAITCGIIATTYPISISESFDKLRKNEMVAAMGSLLIAFAAGGIIGPYMTSLVMVTFGNHYLFWL